MNGTLTKTNGIHPVKSAPSKAKGRPTFALGVYQSDSVKDVADSLGILSLQDSVAGALASDVEYRLHEVIEEATRFMKHAKRSTLSTNDIELALRSLNIDALYGHSPSIPITFRRAQPQHNEAKNFVYTVEDEEIDLERVIREKRVKVPKEIGIKPHWLAVEGVQPAVPENPPPPPSHPEKSSVPDADPSLTAPTSTLPTPLVTYRQKLINALTSGDFIKRTAALASLSSDAGLQLLVPYLVNWAGEKITEELQKGDAGDGELLEISLGMISSMLKNESIFLEPYLHQLLPPVLSVLLIFPHPMPDLRLAAASTITSVINLYSPKYTTLASRLLKTFLRAMLEPDRQLGTRAGAVRGLMSLSVEGVKRGLVDSRGCRTLGTECEDEVKAASDRGQLSELVQAVLDALRMIAPQPGSQTADIDGIALPEQDLTKTLDTSPLTSSERASLEEIFGSYFAELVEANVAWGRALLAAVGVSAKEQNGDGDNDVEGKEMDVDAEDKTAVVPNVPVDESMTA